MRKVAVLTWVDDTLNYGSILQAYAMQYCLLEQGYQAVFINYKSDLSDIEYPSRIVLYAQKIIGKLQRMVGKGYATTPQLRESAKICSEFVRHEISLSERLVGRKALYDLNNNFDTFICGSDQIWSLNAKFNPVYYLDWVKHENKKIAYAPSISLHYVDQRKIKFLKKYVKEFSALSVREQSSADTLGKIIGYKVDSVLDPTLLAGRDFWEELVFSDNRQKNDHYIICYLLGSRNFYSKHIENFSKIKGLPIRVIPIGVESYQLGYKPCEKIGPIQFLELIKNADWVLTDSYHATIFSIIFRKNFYLFERFDKYSKQSQNARIYDLIEKLSLQNYIIDEHSDLIENCKPIEYTNIDKRYDVLREKSLDFLRSAMANKSKEE